MMSTPWHDHIATHSAELAGKPRIKNSRILVEFLLERLADRWSADELLAAYPALTLEDIQAALASAHEFMGQIGSSPA